MVREILIQNSCCALLPQPLGCIAASKRETTRGQPGPLMSYFLLGETGLCCKDPLPEPYAHLLDPRGSVLAMPLILCKYATGPKMGERNGGWKLTFWGVDQGL